MPSKAAPTPQPKPSARSRARSAAGPGRPKDLTKRAAILDAAKRMFTEHGFDGASMDQIAAEAGVSKLTVYSHFGDKETLFSVVVKTFCDQSLPPSLFDPSPDTPLRERLLQIAHRFFAMATSPEAISGHRVMCMPQITDSPLPRLFWDVGPQRVQNDFAALLQRRVDAGQLDIPDIGRAASQFFVLLKGDEHARMVLGCGEGTDAGQVDAHLEATVDMFLRAYAVNRG